MQTASHCNRNRVTLIEEMLVLFVIWLLMADYTQHGRTMYCIFIPEVRYDASSRHSD